MSIAVILWYAIVCTGRVRWLRTLADVAIVVLGLALLIATVGWGVWRHVLEMRQRAYDQGAAAAIVALGEPVGDWPCTFAGIAARCLTFADGRLAVVRRSR